MCAELDGREGPETAIEALVAKSLCEREVQPDGGPRLVMLETIREFAGEHLEGHGELAALRERHLRYFLAWAEAACQHLYRAEQLVWYGLLDREAGQPTCGASLVRAAGGGRRRAGDRGRPAARGRLGVLVLAAPWRVCGELVVARASVQLAAGAEADVREGQGAARRRTAHGALGVVSTRWHDADLAAVRRSAGDWPRVGRRAHMRHGLCWPGYTLPDGAARLASREEALERYRASRDAWGIAWSLWAVGERRAAAGDLRGARLCFEESLATNAAVGDGWVADAARTGLARLAWAEGDVATARTLLEESTALMRDFGDARSIGLNLARLGELAQDVGDSAAARSLYRQALPIFLDTGDHGKIGDVLLGLASLAAAEGALTYAVHLGGAASGISHAAVWLDDDRWSTRHNWLSPTQLCEVAGRRLDQQEVARAWAQGQAMTVEQAVEVAVAELASI